ncbi:MAG: ABC transporter ATP-binding protein [Proteobacteria bacterium]|nr:ABC transporter ATP-binding protein [Pseudomonadota bacterium]
MSALLSISGLHVSYKAVPAVSGVDLDVREGEVRVILGSNGAGKTTIIKAILGLVKPLKGSIRFRDQELTRLPPHRIHQGGISWVPEGRQLWGTLTVLDNLKMGAFSEPDEAAVMERIEAMFERFPRLRERRFQVAGSLSGGEQQMVAIARALVSRPKLILMDEPSLGLAPMVVRDVFALVKEINRMGISILMVEQNARQALKVADWAYLLEVGRMVESGRAAEIAAKESVREIFLGGRA